MKTWTFISGWNLKKTARSVTGVLLISYLPVISANEPEPLNIEFLEFIGSGVDVDNEWVDPIRYQELEEVIPLKEDPEQDEQTNE